MKKLFPEKRLSRKSLLEFLDKKGFYIVLILCIAIVGTTAVFLTTRNINSSSSNYDPGKIIPEDEDFGDLEIEQAADNIEDLVTMQSSTSLQAAASTAPEDTKSGTQSSETKSSTKPEDSKAASSTASKIASNTTGKTAAAKTPQKTQNQSFTMPVFGEITQAFSNNKLLYSRTLEEWRVHSGVDIASDRGTPVKAAAKGVVTDVKNDPMYGITVIIEHPNSIKSVYSNLASDDMVVPNQKVEQGDVIGSVGGTAAFESVEQAHLHFEVWKNNEPVEPAQYLPKK